MMLSHGKRLPKKVATDRRERVNCDDHCGAFANPRTDEEYRAAYRHWRGHGWLSGCSHAR